MVLNHSILYYVWEIAFLLLTLVNRIVFNSVFCIESYSLCDGVESFNSLLRMGNSIKFASECSGQSCKHSSK